MERFWKVGQPMRLAANNYFSPPLGTTLIQYRSIISCPHTHYSSTTTHGLFYSFNFGVEWVSYQT
jgi:hypothetical protein